MEPTLRSTQVLKQEAEDIGLTGKEVEEYMREQHTLDREERMALRDTQKRKLRSEWQSYKQKIKKRADEIHMVERADEIKIQIAKIEAAKEQAKIEAAKEQVRIEADKELNHKELELKAQQDQASASHATTPPPRYKDGKSPSYHPS